MCAGTAVGEGGEPGVCSGLGDWVSLETILFSLLAVLVPNGLSYTTGNTEKVLSQLILNSLIDVGQSCLE